ncbi:hypothetical protein ACFSKU_18380 [Pontibacter silvestris]|uniref:Uncharacterized protein n=1 Tax=Pontibacter silvestris TaxID=2305183 RepID=A0ABW4X2G8_9BACT|nr:hypothetical protein [Pontibacter silvestris]MCC9138671.1 hypothetical protein [Pontibacter silvestris]
MRIERLAYGVPSDYCGICFHSRPSSQRLRLFRKCLYPDGRAEPVQGLRGDANDPFLKSNNEIGKDVSTRGKPPA